MPDKKNNNESDRTELYEREMKHDEHRETPLDTAGREAGEKGEAEEGQDREAEKQREREDADQS